jgi:hypothetical protein
MVGRFSLPAVQKFSASRQPTFYRFLRVFYRDDETSWTFQHRGSGLDFYTLHGLFHQKFISTFLSKDGLLLLLTPDRFRPALNQKNI